MDISAHFVFSGLGLLSFGLLIELYRINFKKTKMVNDILKISMGLGTVLVTIGFILL